MSEINIKRGDCLELMKELPDESVDCIICDLPYGITKACWDEVIPFDKLWEQYRRLIVQGGHIVLFASQPFTTKLISSNYKDYKYTWYWIKNQTSGFTSAHIMPMKCEEDINVFRPKTGDIKYYPQGLKRFNKIIDKSKYKSDIYRESLNKQFLQEYTNYPKNVLNYKTVFNNNKLHPSQKPEALLEYLIKTYTLEGETVLDNTMGSGSTGVACISTNRNFIGMEKDEKFFEIAKKRLEEKQNEIRLF